LALDEFRVPSQRRGAVEVSVSAISRLAAIARLFAVPLGLLVLLNAPFWFFPGRLAPGNPLLNVDGLAVVALLALRARWAMGALTALGLIEIFQVVAVTNYFDSVTAFLQSVRFANSLALSGFWNTPWVALVLAWLLSMAVCWKVLASASVSRGASLILLVAIVAIDLWNGTTDAVAFRRDRAHFDLNVAGSAGYKFAVATKASFNVQPLTPLVGRPAVQEEAWAALHPRGSVLTVVVESMGVPGNALARQWLESQVTSIDPHRWDVTVATTRFDGATTAGELRIMCGLKGSYLAVESSKVDACLPRKFRAMSYRTTAMHGFSSRMFNRHIWWRAIGFESVRFAEDFSQHTPLCGTVFRGVCDTFLVDEALRLADSPSSYVYLLTLNTHLPLTYGELPRAIQDICEKEAIAEGACQMIGQQGMLLRHISTRLAASAATPFVRIVGDHAPPFASLENRKQFDQTLVPEFILVPRSGNGAVQRMMNSGSPGMPPS
jgi:hypothetical protein